MPEKDPAEALLVTLARQIQRRRCVAVIGTGHALEGFAASLADDCRCSAMGRPCPEVAQLFEVRLGRDSLVDRFMKWPELQRDQSEGSCTSSVPFVALESLLASSPIDKFVSLDYEPRLEECLKSSGRGYDRITQLSHWNYLATHRAVVVKPLGDRGDPQSLRITEDDYRRLAVHWRSRKGLASYLPGWLSFNTLLMVNCDPTEKYLREMLLRPLIQDSSGIKIALVEPSESDTVTGIWSALGVHPLRVPVRETLAKLSELAPYDGGTKRGPPPPRRRPYKSLNSYDEDDQQVFFGRAEEANEVAKRIGNQSIVVLCGRSGVGKTSLLRAGVVPILRQHAFSPVYVRVGPQPLHAVCNALATHFPKVTAFSIGDSVDLAVCLDRCYQVNQGKIVLLLDQFEEMLTLVKEPVWVIRTLLDSLVRSKGQLKLVISLREDFLTGLDDLNPRLLSRSAGAGPFRLEAMSRDQATAAIKEPAEAVGLSVEEDLVGALLTDLQALSGAIDPVQLSLVCDRVYDRMLPNERVIPLRLYETLGGARGIISGFADDMFSPRAGEGPIATTLLMRLVNEATKTRAIVAREDLLAGLDANETPGKAQAELERLIHSPIVRAVECGSDRGACYELTHDYLVDQVLAWIKQQRDRAKPVRELVRQNLDTWRTHATLMEEASVQRVDAERHNPDLKWSGEELAYLSLSAASLGMDSIVWLQMASADQSRLDQASRFLLDASQGGPAETRARALECLGRLWNMQDIGRLGSADKATRLSAISNLTRLHDPRAVEPLVSLLDDGDVDVRLAAAQTLGVVGDGRAIEPLAALLQQDDPSLRRAAAKALRAIGWQPAADLTGALYCFSLDDPNAFSSAGALAIDPLVELLRHPDSDIRRQAARSLGPIGDARAVQPLVTLLADSSASWSARDALVRIGPIAVDALVGSLGDTNAEARQSAAQALQKLRWSPATVEQGIAYYLALQDAEGMAALGEQAVPGLVDGLASGTASAPWAIAEALCRIGNPQAIQALLAWLPQQDESTRLAATDVWHRVGNAGAVELLMEQLKDPDNETRWAAIRRLGYLGEKSVPGLLVQLHDEDANLRWTAAAALGCTRDPQVIGALVNCLRDDHPDVRWAAADALGKMVNQPAEEAYLAAVEEAAVDAFGKMVDQHAVQPLAVCLRDEYRYVRKAAAASLREFEWEPTSDAIGAAYWCALGEIDRCVAIGEAAIDCLIDQVMDSGLAIEERGRAVEALTQLHWNPPKGAVRYACEDVVDQLRRHKQLQLQPRFRKDFWADLRSSTILFFQILGILLLLMACLAGAVYAAVRFVAIPLWERMSAEVKPGVIIGLLAAVFILCAGVVAAQRRNTSRYSGKAGSSRRLAVRFVKRTHIPAIDWLAKRLEDSDESVRQDAAIALEALGTQGIAPLVAALQSPSTSVRQDAAQALKRMGWTPMHDAAGAAYWIALDEFPQAASVGAPAVPLLQEALQDADPAKKCAIVATLSGIGSPDVLALISAQLEDPDDAVRLAAANSLRTQGDPATAQPLIARVDDPSKEVRIAVMEALGALHVAEAAEHLLKQLGDDDPAIRIAAVDALGNVGPSITDLLVTHLWDKPWSTRLGVAQVLERLAWTPPTDRLWVAFWLILDRPDRCIALGPEVVPLLVESLGDDALSVRRSAAEALRLLGWIPQDDSAGATYWLALREVEPCIRIGPAAIGPLAVTLRQESAEMRVQVIWALGKIGGADAVATLITSTKDPDAVVRRTAIEAAGWHRAPEAVPALITALSDQNTEVQLAATEALRRLPDMRAVGPLISLAASSDRYVCLAARQTLNAFGSAAIPVLADQLSKEWHHHKQQAIVEVLGMLGDVRAVEPLLLALEGDNYLKPAIMRSLELLGSPAVAIMLSHLRDAAWRPRKMAMWYLAEIKEPRARRYLVQCLAEDDAGVRAVAAQALREMAWTPNADAYGADYWLALGRVEPCVAIGSDAIEVARRRLADSSPVARATAAQALGYTGDRRHVPDLLLCLTQDVEPVQAAAAQALGQIRDPRAVQALAQAFAFGSDNMKLAAREALLNIGQPAVLPLTEFVASGYGDRRLEAIRLLGEIGGSRATACLVDQLRADDGSRRAAAATALGQTWDTAAILPLVSQLQDPEDRVRSAVVEALAQLGAPAVGPLLDRLASGDAVVHLQAAKALGGIGHAAIQPLLRRLEAGDPAVRRAAATALGYTRAKPAVDPLIAALQDSDDSVKQAAAEGLGRLKEERALDDLVRLLNHRNWQVRRSAGEALGALGTPSAVEPLVEALDDPVWQVQLAATRALGQIGDPKTATSRSIRSEALTRKLRSRNAEVRLAAVEALGKTRWQPAFRPLMKTLSRGDPDFQEATAQALAQVAKDDDVDFLIKRLKSRYNRRQQLAAMVLKQIDSAEARSAVSNWQS